MISRVWMIFPVALLAGQTGCATHGTRPHDQGAMQHEAAGQAEEAAAAQHRAQYDPRALRVAGGWGCPGYGVGYGHGSGHGFHHAGHYGYGGYGIGCYPYWTSVWNPTEVHLAEADKRRALAERHRAASQALRDAEARACQGIPAADRDTSPFLRREDIERVEPLREVDRASARAAGARVVFRALPAMTAEWLQRLMNCQAARAAAIGFADPSLVDDPLGLHGATATVRSTGDGFAVDVKASSDRTGNEVLARACRVSGRCTVDAVGQWRATSP